LFLLYFVSAWLKDRFSGSRPQRPNHYLGIIIFTVLSIFLMIGITILLPGGVELSTYKSFFKDAVPLLNRTLTLSQGNISLLGLFSKIFPKNEPAARGLFLLSCGIISLWGLRRHWKWYTWLIAILLTSPLCWELYTTLLLPAFLFIVTRCAADDKGRARLGFLVLSMALISLEGSFVATLGLLLIFYLCLKIEQDFIPNTAEDHS
jgi:hypothetical protein